MSEVCCNQHDDLFHNESPCGLAGMGVAWLCCEDCPDRAWYEKNQPTRPIKYWNPNDEPES